MAFEFMPGATAVGLTCSDAIILAAENRISYGNFIANKKTKLLTLKKLWVVLQSFLALVLLIPQALCPCLSISGYLVFRTRNTLT